MEAGKTRAPRGLVIGLIAAGAMLILIAGGVGAGFALSALAQGNSQPQAEPVVVTPDRSTNKPTDTPTPTVSATPTALPEVRPTVVRQFQSPSGNIRCSVEELGGVSSVTCQQPNINYAVPGQACSAGATGVVVAVNDNGTYWPCLSGDLAPTEILPLDTPLTVNGMHCSISYTTGVTCTNPSGRGFSMEYDRGVQLF